MKEISNWISAYLKGRKERKAEQRKAIMRNESTKTVQVMEFQNQLYISYDGTPLIDIRFLGDVQVVLADARATREKYIESNIVKHHV